MDTKKTDLFHYVECGLDDVYLKSGFELHETSYGEGFSIMDIEGLHRAIGLDIVKNVVSLNASQVRFLRKELNLAQKALADILGVSEDTIRNWETGRREINKAADIVLRTYYSEFVDGDGSVREMIEGIAKRDRSEYHLELEFRDGDSGWHTANIAA